VDETISFEWVSESPPGTIVFDFIK
jgi:hypothetical protein